MGKITKNFTKDDVDLTNIQQVLFYMLESASESDWNRRCDDVKRENDGHYPPMWLSKVILGGAFAWVSARWRDATNAPEAPHAP